MPSQLTVREVRTLPELEALRPYWSSWPGHRDSDIDVFLAICKSNKEVLRPCVLAVERDGVPESLFVARIARSRILFALGYLRVFKPQVRLLLYSYGGFRGNTSAEHSQALVRTILAILRAGEADVAFLANIDADCPLFEAAQSLPAFAFRDRFPDIKRHFKKALPSSAEHLYSTFSKHLRAHVRRDAKRFLADFSGDIKVQRFSEPADMERMIPDIEAVAKKGYQRKLGVGFSESAERLEFFKMQAARGWFRGNVLYAGGKPCAYWLGAIYQQTFTSDFLAFDPEYSKYSPGTFLLVKALEELCSEGIQEVDFGLGEAAYKERFGNSSRREARLYIFAPNFTGFTLSAKRTLVGVIDGPARKLLERTNLMGKVKKAWRGLSRGDSDLKGSKE